MRLIIQEVNRFENKQKKKFLFNDELFAENSSSVFSNTFDKWILARVQDVLEFVHEEFKHYRLY